MGWVFSFGVVIGIIVGVTYASQISGGYGRLYEDAQPSFQVTH